MPDFQSFWLLCFGCDVCKTTEHWCCIFQSHDPSPSEGGGCPFKHFDENNLTRVLASEALPAAAVHTVINTASAGDCSGACCLLLAEKQKKIFKLKSTSQRTHCGGSCEVRCEGKTQPVGQCDGCSLTRDCGVTMDNVSEKESILCRGSKRLRDDCEDPSNGRSRGIQFSDSPYKDLTSEGEWSMARKRRRLIDDRCRTDEILTADQIQGATSAGEVNWRKVHSEANPTRSDANLRGVEALALEQVRNFMHKPIDFYRSYTALLEGLSLSNK